ncbi:putative protein S-acyltransferase [Helianthus debilis subsp. tardiflorus]
MLMRMFSFHFMLPSNLLKVTVVVRLWGWTAVSLSASSLLMFIRCSSKELGYVKASEGIRNNADAEGPLVKINLINSANWTGNWSQLCPTCKDAGYTVGVQVLELLCHREKVVFCSWCIVEF